MTSRTSRTSSQPGSPFSPRAWSWHRVRQRLLQRRVPNHPLHPAMFRLRPTPVDLLRRPAQMLLRVLNQLRQAQALLSSRTHRNLLQHQLEARPPWWYRPLHKALRHLLLCRQSLSSMFRPSRQHRARLPVGGERSTDADDSRTLYFQRKATASRTILWMDFQHLSRAFAASRTCNLQL